ncbi:unnamed protein product [Toxocara canis]|uniref:MARVEL domain-containing protein n=1 Tax=Toxocara canis TaxID=6265 RepID=A0A183UAC8_TOXCA|nr:unnamed protein product [Toxocara canis]
MFDCLNNYLPQKATTNLRHYCFCNRIHVKTGLLAIICMVAAIEFLEMVVFIVDKLPITSPWQIFFEILEAVCFLGLVTAYKTQRSIFMWPFMVSQFLAVMATVLIAIICLLTFVLPRSAYRGMFTNPGIEDEEGNGDVRVRALVSFLFYCLAGILEGWALTITLACHRYFDEVNEARERRMRRNRNFDPRGQGPSSGGHVIAPDSFDNPNYTLPDSDGEEGSGPFQQQRGKPAIV